VSVNIGEEICGEWLKHVRGCEFVSYDLKIPGGEIDVVGLSLAGKGTIYACEVAVHLETGLRYTRGGHGVPVESDNVRRLTEKFRRDAAYVAAEFPGRAPELMFWSPVVLDRQVEEVREAVAALAAEGVAVKPVINGEFGAALEQLRAVAREKSAAMESPVMRLLQIEEAVRA
jgi:Holliday junction resolvase-like predicted endonuclease